MAETGPNAVVNLAIRLWLMVDPGPIFGGPMTIREAVARSFPRNRRTPAHVDFNGNLDDVMLKRVAGITVRRTSILAERLLLNKDNRTLQLFGYEEILQSCQKVDGRFISIAI